MMIFNFFITFLFLFFNSILYGIESNTEYFENTKVKLILGKKQNGTLDIGLDFYIAKDWKIYWIYRDSGLPPELKLLNYEGKETLIPSWPYPDEEFDANISATSRIYKNNIVIPYKLILDNNIPHPKKLEFNLDYQVCKDICIPDNQD